MIPQWILGFCKWKLIFLCILIHIKIVTLPKHWTLNTEHEWQQWQLKAKAWPDHLRSKPKTKIIELLFCFLIVHPKLWQSDKLKLQSNKKNHSNVGLILCCNHKSFFCFSNSPITYNFCGLKNTALSLAGEKAVAFLCVTLPSICCSS